MKTRSKEKMRRRRKRKKRKRKRKSSKMRGSQSMFRQHKSLYHIRLQQSPQPVKPRFPSILLHVRVCSEFLSRLRAPFLSFPAFTQTFAISCCKETPGSSLLFRSEIPSSKVIHCRGSMCIASPSSRALSCFFGMHDSCPHRR